MATPIKYRPSQKVNIGVGLDNVNDFARKYNLQVDEIYKILNLRSARQVFFRSDSIHWEENEGGSGYTLSIPHNGNAVFAIYQTDYAEGVSTMVPAADIIMDGTNVTIEADAPFDGFMMYAGLNDDVGLGSNLTDDVVQQIIEDTKDEFADDLEDAKDAMDEKLSDAQEVMEGYLEDAQNFAESEMPFHMQGEGAQDPTHNSAKHYADAAAESYNGLLAINTQAYLDYVVALLEEQTSVLTSGYWDMDVFGCLMPKNTSETDLNWEVDENDNLMPTVVVVGEGNGD